MEREKVTPAQVAVLSKMLGLGAVIVDLHNVDYSRGRGILEGNDRCLWTRDGKRITIAVASDGGMITSQSREVDPELPEPAFEVPDPFIRMCINPDCKEMVDLRKRKSGACCKAHLNYQCTHPDCVARALDNGWPRATHPYGTKIARAHMSYRLKAE